MAVAADVIVVGGGVAGLGAALALSRQGRTVSVLERDPTPLPASAEDAFDWVRRGAPQLRHSHAFLARLRNLLRDHYPDVLAALVAAGATEQRLGAVLPPTLAGFEAEPDDADVVMLSCRRTTFEWVLRRAVLAEPGVTIRSGSGVVGLVTDGREGDSAGGAPVVTGVRLEDGSSVTGGLTVVATGRRSAIPEWLATLGAVPVEEEVNDTGIVYLSRFYLAADPSAPLPGGPIGGDLGYVKYGVFGGDNRTFSVTLAVPVADQDLRRHLGEPAAFERAARSLTAAAPWLDARPEAISGVHVMAGLINRWRDFVRDGAPVAVGVHAIGDAQVCTNPLYGRGCTTGFWQAHLLAEALHAHPDDQREQVLALDAASRLHLRPWYRASVYQDVEARRVAAALLAGDDPDDPADPKAFMRSVFRDGLVPALRHDAVVFRAFVRSFNLLSPPDAMFRDDDIRSRVLAAWQERAQRPPAEAMGPENRSDLLAILSA